MGVCRHFALLFATGACAPPPSSAQVDGPERKARVSSLKELDQHLFLDALVDVSTLNATTDEWYSGQNSPGVSVTLLACVEWLCLPTRQGLSTECHERT